MYERGDMTQNWLLQDGDIVNVGDRFQNRIFVFARWFFNFTSRGRGARLITDRPPVADAPRPPEAERGHS